MFYLLIIFDRVFDKIFTIYYMTRALECAKNDYSDKDLLLNRNFLITTMKYTNENISETYELCQPTLEDTFSTILPAGIILYTRQYRVILFFAICSYMSDLFFVGLNFRDLQKISSLLSLSLIHISEPTRLLSISYAVFCLKKKK